jgi:hypothetical protein
MTETKKSKPLIKEETDKGSFKDRYKDCIANLNKVPTVNIKGKQYSTVAERHRHLKNTFLNLGLMKKSYFMMTIG